MCFDLLFCVDFRHYRCTKIIKTAKTTRKSAVVHNLVADLQQQKPTLTRENDV